MARRADGQSLRSCCRPGCAGWRRGFASNPEIPNSAVDDHQLRLVALAANIAADGRRSTAGTGAHDDPRRLRVRLVSHLAENAVGDIVITAPVGGALSEGELIHIVAIQLARQHFRSSVDFAGVVDEMTPSAIKLNLFDFTLCRPGGHHGNKRQAQQASKIGF